MGFWSSVLWSDGTKIELFGQRGVSFVLRMKGEAFNPKNPIPTVKHCGGKLVLFLREWNKKFCEC